MLQVAIDSAASQRAGHLPPFFHPAKWVKLRAMPPIGKHDWEKEGVHGLNVSLALNQLNVLRSAAMPRSHKPDPYDGFKNDVERRRALTVREIRITVIGVAIALCSSPEKLKETVSWLKTLFL